MSRLASWISTALGRAGWLAAICLMLAALYVSLGRQLLPLLAEYRYEVQVRASEALQTPVSIGRLEGHWSGFTPHLVALDVVLGEGGEAMSLDRLMLVPDIAGSLRSRRLLFRTVELSGLRLSVAQDEKGGWSIEGMGTRRRESPVSLPERLAELQRVGRMSVLDSHLTIQPYAQAPQTLTYANLELQNHGQRLRLSGSLLLPDGQPLELDTRFQIGHSDWQDSQVQLYARLPESDWAKWLPGNLVRGWEVQQLQAGGELWLDWRGGTVERAVLQLSAPTLAAGRADAPPVQVSDLSVAAYLDRSEQGFRLLLQNLTFALDDHAWPESTLVVQRDSTHEQWHVETDRLPVEPMAALLYGLLPMPDVASTYLTGLAPTGLLRNVRLAYRPQALLAERLTYEANLDAVSIQDHQWIPAVHNVSGLVRGNLAAGELHFDSQGLGLHLAQLFEHPWSYQRSRGSLKWGLDEEAFTLTAPYVQAEGPEGLVAGDFLIRLMRKPGLESYMDLRVGIQDADARYVDRYLPTRLPVMSPELSNWLQTAILGGQVEQGYVQFQGSLSKDASPEARSVSMYFRVRDGDLAFRPGWPVLREGQGEVLIEDDQIRVRLSEARLLDSRVHDAQARIALGNVRPLRLTIEGQVEGDLHDGLSLMQVAPIGTGELFSGWRGQGEMKAALQLDIPLAEGEKPRVVADFSSRNASLYMTQADLQLRSLNGAFRYDSERGLSASGVSAQALGTRITGRASAIGTRQAPATRIEAEGVVALEQLLKWRKISQPLPVSGELPFQLRLTLDGRDNRLQVDSSLLGTHLQLPFPFAKPAGERRDTTLTMTLGGDRQQYHLQHDRLAALAFSAPGSRWTDGGGELILGSGAARLRSGPGLRIRGRLPSVELAQWQALLKDYGTNAQGGGTASLLHSVQLQIDAFEGMGAQVANLGVDLRRRPDGWMLELDSQVVAGKAHLPDNKEAALVLELSHLRLPAAEPVAEPAVRSDPLSSVDPRSLPALDARIAQVWQGGQPLGAWSLKMRPVAGGVEFSELDLDFKGLRIKGGGSWSAGRTWYKGRLEGSNLADILLAWGFAPSTTSERFHLDADTSWPGSPAYFSIQRLSGQLAARLRNGQLREVEGGAQALRVFGLLNFDSVGRRLRLDFSDLFSKGLSYDRIKADLLVTDGVYMTQEPLSVTGPSSNLELNGKLDLVRDEIDATLLVTLPVSNNLPLAALIVGAPAIGGALLVFDKLLGDSVARFASVLYKVEGPWQSPKITFEKPFEKPN